jgi:hypothetical protein
MTQPKRKELINIEITPENNEQALNFELKPFDVVIYRRTAMYEKNQRWWW